MGNEFFEQGDLPEKVFRGFVRRVRVDEKPVQVCIISPNWWKCHVHYRGRTIGCLKDKEKCPGCRLFWPRKVLGYLYVRNERTQKYEHLELPFEAGLDLTAMIGNSLMRGTRFIATREGGKTGPIKFNLLARLDDVAPGFELPGDVSPGTILEYLWGVNYGKLRLADDSGLSDREAV